MCDTGTVLGIDACPAGWAVCSLDPSGNCRLTVVDDADSLVPLIEPCDLACIDIPLGILDDAEREVDRRAKSVLGRYHARVFMTPPRPVLDQPCYRSANAESRRLIGKGLSKQAWNILPKVRSIDALLQKEPSLCSKLRECHPEIALWGLGGKVVSSNKATPEGRTDRLRLLGSHIDQPERRIEAARSTLRVRDAKDDDLIDAMICAVVGAGAWDKTIRGLDDQLPCDATGLPTEISINIWYRDLQ